MLRMRAAPRCLAAAGAAVLASAVLGACGGGDGGDGAESAEIASAAAPPAGDFPAADGRSLEEIIAETTPSNDLVASPAGMVFTPGPNRFGFGVFTAGGEQVVDAEIAVYAAPGPDGKAIGPFPARIESLETDPAFEARTTADDPDAAKVVYVSDVKFDETGEWRLLAVRNDSGKLVSGRMPSVVVDEHPEIPAVGDKAPAPHTPTAAEVADVGEIDTRDPHDTMHDTDLAEVAGRKPVVLLYATPALCVSRVCGPVVDAAEQVKSELGDDAAFVHSEVYRDNDPNAGILPALREYGLETEPWLFVLDADGEVSTRIEGAFSVEELRDAVEKAS
jgi:hypothetical protein